LKGRNLEVFVRSSETDQEDRGFMFHLSGERKNGLSIPDVFEW